MPTARHIITQALKNINVVGTGQNLSAEDANDGLIALNNILSQWSIEGGLVYTESREQFPLQANKAAYTIGSGQDFDTTKPYEVTSVFVNTGGNDYSLDDYDQSQYALITNKDTTGIPSVYYYDNNYPVANMILWPVPSTAYTLNLYSYKVLDSFANLTTNINLPAGYERALIFNLSVDRAPSYEREASQTVKDIASESKAMVFASNQRNENNVSYVDNALIGYNVYNIYEGN